MGDLGCTNHGCPFAEPGGIKTNGSCKCVYNLVRSAKDGEQNVNLVANELDREFRRRNKRIAELEAENKRLLELVKKAPVLNGACMICGKDHGGLQCPTLTVTT